MSKDDEEKLDYAAAHHAVQSGVAYEHSKGSNDGTPKMLRTGINMAMVDHTGLVRLLIEKGIISEAEYLQAITDEANREVERYEERLNAAAGRPGERVIKLR